MFARIAHELKHHVPFTLGGTVMGIGIMLGMHYGKVSGELSEGLFQVCHPLHVLLSAVATTAMYRLHGRRGLLGTIIVGYIGSVGIATLSDCVVPYLGELVLGASCGHIEPALHLGFIEEWWLVNPLAAAGIAIACWRPRTEFPHAGHVLLSTWASLFHMLMAVKGGGEPALIVLIPVFLFLAVWIPCCASDIVFPLLFARRQRGRGSSPAS
ncbi:hypothetical protein LCGC14_1580140 [marine sediment metagenome]|uniref:Uncharacterized protein n=1 Tax=marine sediment metagenome TaxID=412755 RepID=A0A0F9LHC8_9ZZZZ